MKKIRFVTQSHTIGTDDVAIADLLERTDVELLLDPVKTAIEESEAARKEGDRDVLKECGELKRQMEAMKAALTKEIADVDAALKRRDGELEAFRDKTLHAIREEIGGCWKDDVEKALAPHFECLAGQFRTLAEERAALEAQWQAIARHSETVQAIAQYFVAALRSDLDARQSDLDRAKGRVEALVAALSAPPHPPEIAASTETPEKKGKQK